MCNLVKFPESIDHPYLIMMDPGKKNELLKPQSIGSDCILSGRNKRLSVFVEILLCVVKRIRTIVQKC